MLSIGKLGHGQERYYLDKVAEGAEDYYSGEGEAEGQWKGDAAKDLGLAGAVEPDQLTAMLTGRNPATGDPLGLRAVGGRGAVPGFDLTFSVPKSASLLWALGDPKTNAAVNAALDRSADAALGYLQREACWTRRGAEAEFVKGSGFLAAAYRHRTSRAGDPQLHVHTLIANATQGPDGKWTRLHHPSIYEHAKTAGYLFEAQFRHELSQSLGVKWQEVRNGIAEIQGFADSHLREFSTRRKEILEATGPDASARSRQIAALTTRTAKEEGVKLPALRQRWRSRAEEIGLTAGVIERAVPMQEVEAKRQIEREEERRQQAAREQGAVAIGRRAASPGEQTQERQPPTPAELAEEVTAHASHFDRRAVTQAVGQLARDGAPVHEIEAHADAFLASPEVIRIGEGAGAKGERFTTKRIWELERRALATAAEMQARTDRAVAGERIAANVISLRPSLKEDQREMVHRLLTSGEGIQIVIGEAGSGKSYATVAAGEGWEAAGISLRVAAPTWRAANVLRSEGLEATSIARLLAELDRLHGVGRQGLLPGSVLLVDEAGMVDSATLARLIEHAEQAEAKLVLVGDPEQLAEIEAGGLYRALAERGEPIHLSEVIRHRNETEREGAKLIREGEGREAIALYRAEDRVVIAADPTERRELMVAEWQQSVLAGEDAVMVAKRNAEVERLNERARVAMREAGRLGDEEIEVGEGRFAVGDQVITRVNDNSLRIYNRERWEVVEVDMANRRIVLAGIDQERRVEVGAAYLDRTNPHGDAPALQHAYAITTYSAQGTTVDRAFVCVDPSMDKQELYVAASRSRGETHLYATPEVQAERQEIAPRSAYLRNGIPHIAEAAERDRSQRAAHDVVELAALPDSELDRLVMELRTLAKEEVKVQSEHERLTGRVDSWSKQLDRVERNRERLQSLPRRQRRARQGEIEFAERQARAELAGASEELRTLPVVERGTRDQLAAVEALRAQRQQLPLQAARLSPPPYVLAELGERPAAQSELGHWERAVAAIERYRREHGVSDPTRALGPEPALSNELARKFERAEHELRRHSKELDWSRGGERSHDLGDEIELNL